MKHLVFAVVVGAVLIVSSERAYAGEDACRSKFPPIDAGVNENHGVYLFVYPKRLGEKYSGCQTMWGENGNVLFVLTFESGRLVKYESIGVEQKSESICIYENGGLGKGDADICPDYDDVRHGFRVLQDEAYLQVPKERDPRLPRLPSKRVAVPAKSESAPH